MIALFRNGYDLEVKTHDGRNFILLNDKDIVIGETMTIYRMPKGAQSDGASIPQFLWSAGLAPFGPYWPAAYAHDCAYKGSLLVYQDNNVWVPAMLPRDICDNLLMALMIACGVEQRLRDTIYNAVRTCGIVAFREDRELAI